MFKNTVQIKVISIVKLGIYIYVGRLFCIVFAQLYINFNNLMNLNLSYSYRMTVLFHSSHTENKLIWQFYLIHVSFIIIILY